MPFSDYEIQGELERTGEEIVYRARSRSTGRLVRVAMSLLPWSPRHERDRDVYQEVALLDHPNILPVLEVDRCDHFLYVVRPHLFGTSIENTVRQGRVPPEAAAGWVAQLARGVQHAHDHGIFPRTLAADGVLLGDDGVARLVSFDNARVRFLRPPPPMEGHIRVGRPAFMPPELVLGKETSDSPTGAVWGLGALLYLLLTAEPPFLGDSPLATLVAVVSELPPSPRALEPAVDPALDALCRRCMHQKPENRYATAEEVALELERWLRGELTAVRRPAAPGLSGWIRRWWSRG